MASAPAAGATTGRFAAENRRRQGQGKPETFHFLGFVHISGQTRQGKFTVPRRTIARRLAAKLREVKATLRQGWHVPLPELLQGLSGTMRGYYNYFAVPGNLRMLHRFRDEIARHVLCALRRRSQRARLTWAWYNRVVAPFLPRATIKHPYPSERFYAKYPREEPYAGKLHVRICAGGPG